MPPSPSSRARSRGGTPSRMQSRLFACLRLISRGGIEASVWARLERACFTSSAVALPSRDLASARLSVPRLDLDVAVGIGDALWRVRIWM